MIEKTARKLIRENTIERFKKAQEQDYELALEEVTNGKKKGDCEMLNTQFLSFSFGAFS